MTLPSDSTEPIVFVSIELERFRAFNERCWLPLDASAIVVSGANGRGKTSLIDGLQWLLVGEIPRLRKLRSRLNEEYIVNRYAPTRSTARVAVEFRTFDGDLYRVVRTGNYLRSYLEVFDGASGGTAFKRGDEAEEWMWETISRSADAVAARRAFSNYALLEQDDVRAFLTTSNDADRYRILTSLLGLNSLDGFVDQLAESHKRHTDRTKDLAKARDDAEQQLRDSLQQLHELEARVSNAPLVDSAVREMRTAIESVGLIAVGRARNWFVQDGQSSAAQDVRLWQQSLNELSGAIESLFSLADSRPPKEVQELANGVEADRRRLTELNGRLKVEADEEAHRLQDLNAARQLAESMETLATVAIPLLSERCPVCDQSIDITEVRRRLESIGGQDSGLTSATARHTNARDAALRTRAEISDLEVRIELSESALANAQRWTAGRDRVINEISASLAELEALSPPTSLDYSTFPAEWRSQITEWLSTTSNQLHELLEKINISVAAHFAAGESSQITRLQELVNRRRSALDEATAKQARVARTARARGDLVRKARESSTEVVNQAFGELAPAVQDLFIRLAPHPTFTNLTFTHDIYRNRGSSTPVARDSESQQEISPLVGFSSAQANVASLCYFIAMAFASSESDFGFVLLDDPLQSMDDVNALGFSDLCRFLRREKQLFISSHEERLANLLERKLTAKGEPFRTISLEFKSWNRPGPEIDVKVLESSPRASVLEAVLG